MHSASQCALQPCRVMIILPSEGFVEMIVTPNRSQVLFHTQNLDLVSRLIDGTFPNFRQIIPKEHTTRAVVETKQFAEAIKRAALFARDSSNITRVKINAGEDDGPELQIIFNVKYLADVLTVISTPEVALEANAATKPGVIRPVGADDYTYVIMPMHINR